MHLSLKQIHKHETTMRDRFIARVLVPPFLLLLVLGGVGYWQLNILLRNQAISDMQIAADATAVRLEREVAIRETVLKNTAEEIANIKDVYIASLEELQSDRLICRRYYVREFTFNNSPGGACRSFITSRSPSLEVIEDKYISEAKKLQSTEIDETNKRLAAFNKFFPETRAVMILDERDEIVSSAVSGQITASSDYFKEIASEAQKDAVKGRTVQVENIRLAVFAFPINGGSVLAAFDANADNYIKPSWESTPINTTEAAAVVLEARRLVVYPALRDEAEFIAELNDIEPQKSNIVDLAGVRNVVVAEEVDESDWIVTVASPEALVFAPVRDAQFLAFVLAGAFIVGFLWVGAFFIKRMTDNIAKLATGAMVYGSGRLDYKVDISSSEKEFIQLANTMNFMAQKIADSEKEKDERNKEFISIATHELRAPMTAIMGYLSLLEESQTRMTKKNKMLLENALEGTTRLRELVNDMLDAARLEGGREEFNIVKVDAEKAIKDVVESMKVVAKENKVSLTYDSKGVHEIYADEAKLHIILNNFVSNALKYNHKSGHVRISHERHDHQLVTAIANSGPTIPDEQKQHMFEKFFRVDTPDHRKVTGTGVGMYVTKQYVLAMGGEIWFSSKTGEDNIFYFSLPMTSSGKPSVQTGSITPQSQDSQWIMKWRKRLR